MLKINWLACIILVGLPIFVMGLGIDYASRYDLGWFEFGLFVLGYYGSNISVGIGLHRLWSHGAYKTNKVVEFILVMMSAGTLQGPALAWASDHYRHHTHTDKELDPHSPLKYKNRIVGFLWSHIGWMLLGEGSHKNIDKVTIIKLGKNKLLTWQFKYYVQIATSMNTVVPFAVGYILGGDIVSAYAGLVFIGLGRALQQEMTFCINSISHFMGSKKYYKGTAGDNWWLAPLLLGENWHNFHHAFPSDYRNGPKWYQFDVHKWIIFGMSKVGLAWDLDRTPEVRVQAKASETATHFAQGRKQQLTILQEQLDKLASHFYNKLHELEDSSVLIKQKLQKSFLEIQGSLGELAQQLQSSIQLADSDKLLKATYSKYKETESAIYKLINKFDKLKSRAFS